MFDVTCVICSAYTKLFWTNYGVEGVFSELNVNFAAGRSRGISFFAF